MRILGISVLGIVAGVCLVGAAPRRAPVQPPLEPGENDSLTLLARRQQPEARAGHRSETARFTAELQTVAINNTLDRFHEAASKADFDAYFSVWTEESVFLGTDATERWVGPQFKDFAKPIFDKGKGWTYRPHDRHITLMPGGGAYFDELLDNAKLGLCRGSGVLAKQGDDWKVLQYNLSIPLPNALAEDFAKRIKDATNAPAPAGKPGDTAR